MKINQILVTLCFILFVSISNIFVVNGDEVRMALLLEGQVDDLGINYEVNQGLAETEAVIRKAAKVINDVNSYDTTYDTIKELLDADEPYNLIITSSEVQKRAALDVAKRYTKTYFLIFGDMDGVKIPHNKVGSYHYNLVSPHFILGFIAGGFGKSVGMVVPGPPTENYYTANAFYTGITYYGASNTKLSVVSTSSYNDIDTATGAGRILISNGIEVVTQSQTDMTVANMFLNVSRLAFGTNGFPQSSIYGNRILQSVVHDFQVPFLEAAYMIGNNTWPANYHFMGDFSNNFLALDYYSFLIPELLKNQTQDLIQKLKDGEKPYLTAPGSITYSYEDLLKQTKLFNGVQDLGYYAVPTTEVYTTGATNKTFMAITILEMAVCLVIGIIVVFFFNRNIMIIYSTIPYCLTILLGAALIAVAIFLWNLRNLNTQICIAKIWMASLGYNVLIGFIIIKSSLIYFRFQNMVKTKTEKINPVSYGRVLLWFIPLLVVDCVLLIIYSTSGNPGKIDSLGLDGIGRYEFTQNCVNNLTGDILLYIILVFHGLQLLYGCVIAWKTRIIDLEEFIETHDFATAIYLISFCSFIIVILMVGVTSTSNRNTIISACAIFSSFSCVLIIFGAKFWKIYKPVEDDGLPQIKLKTQKSSSGSGNTSTGHSSGGSKSKKTSAHSSGVKSGSTPNTTQSAMASINIQNFVNPIEAASRSAPRNED